MDFSPLLSSSDIVFTAKKDQLYEQLILQLEKDFALANEKIRIAKKIKPEELIIKIETIIYNLIATRFNDYINLLYIVDLPEEKVKKLDGSSWENLTKEVTYLILKREWQKVWFKNYYK